MGYYDFDTVIDRRDTYSLKWDVASNELPLWVADMDFATAPEITTALQERVDHGIFGYTLVPDAWRRAICTWWSARHKVEFDPSWLVFCTGVVPALSSIVRKMTCVGEKVLIQTPVYNIFFNSIINNGRFIVESELVYKNGLYHVDFEDLEAKLADPQVTMMILCNPHNPIGMIWNRETLARIGELCARYGVLIVSDEIHCDLTDPGCNYTPFASVSETCASNSITCIAPTKAFNIAGLQTAAVVVPNAALRYKVERGLNTDEVAEPNVFAITAAITAFEQGGPWLDELRAYIAANKQRVRDFIAHELPQVRIVPSQATYLLWLDCSALSCSSNDLAACIRQRTGLRLCAGSDYGTCGDRFLRLNVACPRTTLDDALTRLKAGVEGFGGSPS